MNHDQLAALQAWILAAIDVKIGDAFGRDTLPEARREYEYRQELFRAFGVDQ